MADVAESELGSPGRQALRMFLRNRAAVFGLVLLTGIVLMTLFGSFFYDQDPSRIIARPLQGPGEGDAPAFGTDYLGRDVLAGVVNGGSTSLTVALVAVFLVVVIGVTIGALAGYYGGWIDTLLMRFTEVFQVLPALLFAMVIVAFRTEHAHRCDCDWSGIVARHGSTHPCGVPAAQESRVREGCPSGRSERLSDHLAGDLSQRAAALDRVDHAHHGRRDLVRVGAGVPRAR